MEDLFDPEEKIICPYDSSHHIRRCKMSFHLVKCKKNAVEQKMVPCDFNATHIIPEPELRYHHQMCPDRKKIEVQIRETKPTRSDARFPIPNIAVDAEESWDDLNVPSYDPNKYVENNEILRHLDVESGAKRKNFRLSERQRLGTLMTPQENGNSVPPTESQPQKGAVKLPPHRTVTTVSEQKFNPALFRQKLRSETNKVFLQYKSESTSSTN